MNETNKRYTRAEAAEKMGISQDTLRELIRQKLIIPFKLMPGATRDYFTQAEIDRYFAEREKAAREEAGCVVDCVAYRDVEGFSLPSARRSNSQPVSVRKKALR